MVPLLGSRFVILVTGAQTDGRCAVVRSTVTPENPGSSLHWHAFDAVVHVRDAALTLWLNKETIRAETRTTVFASRGAAHTDRIPDPVPATYLLIITPAGFAQHFVDLTGLVAERGRPDQEVMRELCPRYGIEPIEPTGEPRF